MDVYSGALTPDEICEELLCFLKTKKLSKKTPYSVPGQEKNQRI